MRNKIQNVLLYGFIIWIFYIFAKYFSSNSWPIGHFLKSISGAFLVLMVSVGIGRKTVGILTIRCVTFIEELSVSASIGLGVLQILILLIGAVGLFTPAAVFILLSGLAILTYKDIFSWINSIKEKVNEHSQNRFSFIGSVFLIILVVSLGIAFINSVAPPISQYELSSGLAVAKRYVLNGAIYSIPNAFAANLPPGMNMLGVMGLLIYGPSVSKLITFIVFLILAIGIYSMTRRFFHRKIALFATTITITTPFIVRLYFIDHPFILNMLFSFMAFYAFIAWSGNTEQIKEENFGWLVLVGLFTGFSLFAGYFAMFVPMAMIIMILYRMFSSPKENSSTELIISVAYFVLPFTLVMIPLFIKNIVMAGTPIFPFFSSDIGIEAQKSLWGYLLPLWQIPFEAELSAKNLYYLGPVFIVFLPGILLIKEVGKTFRLVASYFLIYFLIYIIMGRRLVFLISNIPVLSIMAAYILVNLYGIKKFFYQFIMSVFLASIAINVYSLWPWVDLKDKMNLALGYTAVEEYLFEKVNGYDIFTYINDQTPQDTKLLLVGEKRSFYVNKDIESSDISSKDPFIMYLKASNSPEELKILLKDNDITHILADLHEIKRLIKYHNYEWNEIAEEFFKTENGYLTSLIENNNIKLYEL